VEKPLSKLFWSTLVTTCGTLILAVSAFSQVPGASLGLPPHGTFTGGPDSINLGNLNNHIEIPIYTTALRGRTSRYSLAYDSSVYQNPGGFWTNNTFGYGWSNTFSDTHGGYVQASYVDDGPCGHPATSAHQYELNSIAYISPDGVEHDFAGTTTYNRCTNTATPFTASSGYGYSITAKASLGGGSVDLIAPSGTHYLVGVNTSDWSITPLDGAKVRDTNGNTAGESPAQLTLGAGPSPSPLPGTITYTDTNGNPQTVTLQYTSMIIMTAFGAPGVTEYSLDGPGPPESTPFLTSISLPDGTSYSFTYEPTPGNSCCTTGRLASITLPTGGTISYQYTGGYGGILLDGTTAGITRTTSDGPTYYSRSNVNQTFGTGSTTTTVQDALGNQTVLTFVEQAYNYYETSRAAYRGAAGGTLLRSTSTCYNGSTAPCTTTAVTLPFNQIARSTTLDNGNTKSTTTFYNSMSLPTETDITNFGGSLLSKTLTSYGSLGNNILDRPSSVTIQDGSGNQFSQTTYSYDEYSLASTSNLPGHQSVSGDRGNQTTAHHWLNTTNSTIDTHHQYDDAGQIVSSTDGRNNTTTFGYDPGTDICMTSTTLPTPSSGVTQSISQACDPNTNLVTSTTDPNGATTAYSYDAMLRPTGTTVTSGGSTAAKNTIAYSGGSLPETITTTVTATPNPAQVSTTTLDPYGRVSTAVGSNGATVVTTYDSSGRVSSVTNPYFSTGDATYGITGFTYDALGRNRVQTEQDGNTLQWSYSGNVVTFTDEANHSWQLTSDALGRLTNVVELGAIPTAYSYDPLGNLTNVTQSGVGGETPRIRSFVHDSLSRLTSATNPETGTIGYGYDANGNVSSKTDARGVATSYTYDVLNRLTFKHYSDGTSVAAFGYDGKSEVGIPLSTYGIASSNSIGRLSLITNLVNAAASFSYDPVGRVAQRNYCVPSDCSWGLVAKAAYDLAGNVTSLTYPDGRVVTQGLDAAGHLQNVTFDNWNGQHIGYNYASALTYTPSGAQAEVLLGNGVYTHTPYNNRQQICQFWTYNGQQVLMDKHYAYANSDCGNAPGNNGNITQIGDVLNNNRSQGFGYDALNRLASFSNGDGSMQQSYTIDSFGNMSTVVGGVATATFDPATNRISNLPCAASVTPFDAAGNQLCDTDTNGAVRQYGVDGESRITQIAMLGSTSNPFETYVYDANGNRVRKTNGTGTYTEYVYFNGQPLAEKNSDGTWSDYIYANGQKIARADSYDVRIHFTGTNCSGCGQPQAWAYNIPLPAYTIQSGDKIAWRQYQTGPAVPRGGLGIQFSDGTYSNWVTPDQNGQIMNDLTTQNQWVYRVADLSQYAGQNKTIQAAWINEDARSGAGNWEEYFSDIAFFRKDGTVQPIYNRQTNVSYPSFGYGGVTNQTFEVQTVPGLAWEPLNNTTYYVGDHLGSTRLEVAGGGWPVSSNTFYPFGQEQSPTADPNHYKFTGKERDTESGLDYFGARYYGSNMGRFTSPDDGSDQNPGNPQSWNLYSYGRNNPLIGTDPDGRTYNVCPTGVTSGSSGCTNIDDKTFEANQKQDQANGVSYSKGTISDSSGTQGTYTHDPDIAGNPASNMAAMGNIGNQGMAAIRDFTVGSVVGGVTGGLGLATFGGGVGALTTVEGLSDAAASQAPKLIIRGPQLAHALRVAIGHNTPLGTVTEIRLAVQAAIAAGAYTVGPNGVAKGTAMIQGVAHEFTGFVNGSQFIFSNIYRQ
jgi:RHS repeat-associated protein